MEREKRTRQSNREYQERIRREYTRDNSGGKTEHFRVIPRSPEDSARTRTISQDRTQEKRTAGANRSSRQSKARSNNGSRQRKSQNRPVQKKAAKQKNQRQQTKSRQQTKQSGQNVQKKKETTTVPKKRENIKKIPSRRTKPQQERTSVVQPKAKPVYFDYTLVFIVIFLVMFGLLMLYTASLYTQDFFTKQCKIAVASVVVMVVLSFFDYHLYAKSYMPVVIILVAIVLVLLVKSPLGASYNGASRWIKIKSLTIQPAEVFKIAIILVNAVLITKFSRKMGDWRILTMFLAMTILEFFFIYKVTENLSSAIIIAMITVLMVFVACPKNLPFVIGGILVVAAVAFVIYYVKNFGGSGGGFRSERIVAWLTPERLEDQSKVFQSNQALYAIGSGGLWGKGLGAGIQKMTLPEAMNDMIFAIICEELGIIGASLVMVMFAILLYRLMFIAKNAKDLLGGMIATGVFAHFMLQVILNIGVVTNLLPSTGVTLPFISSGGTALLLLMTEIGIALNVSRQIDFEQPQLMRRRIKKKAR